MTKKRIKEDGIQFFATPCANLSLVNLDKISPRQTLVVNNKNILHSARYHSNISFLCIFFVNKAGPPAAHVTIVHCVGDVKNVSLLKI